MYWYLTITMYSYGIYDYKERMKDLEQMLKTVNATLLKEKMSRASTLEILPSIYKNQIKSILEGIEKFEMNEKEIQRKKELISTLKDTLDKNMVYEITTKQIYDCLNDISESVERKEKMYYRKKTVVNSFFDRFKFFVAYPNLALMPLIMSDIEKNSKHLINVIGKLSLEELKILDQFSKNNREIEKIIETIIVDVIKKIIDAELYNYSEKINKETKEYIVQEAYEKFPNVGNNKLRFFDRPNQIKELDKKFCEYMTPILQEYFLDYISYNIDRYWSIANIFHDFIASVCFVLTDGSIDTIYTDFSQQYVDDIFSKTQENKTGIYNKKKSNQIVDMKKFNDAIKSHTPKKSISTKIIDIINEFLETVNATDEEKQEVKRLFLKRYRTKTEIRIQDLEKKYGIPSDAFWISFLQKFKDVGFNIKNVPDIIDKEVPHREESIKEEPWEEKDSSQKETIPYDEIWKEKNSIKICEAYGYTITNPKKFEKQIDILYDTEKKKEWFFTILKKNIEKPEKRNSLNYWAIDLKYGHRILIFNKNEIDGIYNHEEYTARVKASI